MTKSKHTPKPPLPQHQSSFRAHLLGSNGNGHDPSDSAPEADTHRLARIEALLERMQQALDTQFTRIATLQAQFDRLEADRRRLG